MPPTRESLNAKSERLRRQSEEIGRKADLVMINSIVKSDPAAMAAVKELLLQSGKWQAPAVAAAAGIPPPAPPGAAARIPVGGLVAAAAPAAPPTAFNLGDPAPSSPAAAPAPFLQFVLQQLEPAALSLHAQRGLLRAGQRLVPKVTLLEILTFAVDQEPTANWEHLSVGDLIARLGDLNRELGRRGRDLRMPISWAEQGHYKATVEAGQVMLKNLVGEVRAVEDQGFVGATSEDLAIAKNYCRKSAALVRHATLVRFPCIQAFPLQPIAAEAAVVGVKALAASALARADDPQEGSASSEKSAPGGILSEPPSSDGGASMRARSRSRSPPTKVLRDREAIKDPPTSPTAALGGTLDTLMKPDVAEANFSLIV